MDVYEELLSISKDLNELKKTSSEEFRQWLNRFTRTQLILIHACGRIGLTGQGELWDHRMINGFPASFYPLPLEESPSRLLERYARFYAFETRESLTHAICRSISIAEHVRTGLDLLKKCSEKQPSIGSVKTIQNNESDSVREALFAEHDPSDRGDFALKVAMDNSDGIYIFFEFRKDVAMRIESLQDRFYDWMYGEKSIHPFRIHHKTYEGEKLTYEGWYYIQGPHDFVDWINTQVYGERVGKEMRTCPIRLTQASAQISF